MANLNRELLPHESNLLKWNRSMFFLHFIQGALALVFSLTFTKAKAFAFPIMTHYVEWLPDASGQTLPQVVEHTVFKLHFGVATSLFALMSALAHLIVLLN